MPRPRFTLRVVLAVTVIVALLAWQGGIAYQRRAALTKVRASANAIVTAGNATTDLEMRLNPIRKFFGDESIRRITIRRDISDDEFESLSRLFPEASVGKWILADPHSSAN